MSGAAGRVRRIDTADGSGNGNRPVESAGAGKQAARKSADLNIRIAGLTSGGYDFEFHTDPAALGLDERFVADVVTLVRMEKSPSQILIRADVRAEAEEQCDRCLSGFNQLVEGSFALVFIYDESAGGSFPAEEMRVIRTDTTSLDIAADVRDVVRLSEPLKLLCREDCKGLCSVCGADLNHAPCSHRVSKPPPAWKGIEKLL